MPFQSAKQRAFLYAKKPDVAKKLAKHEREAQMDVIEKKLKK